MLTYFQKWGNSVVLLKVYSFEVAMKIFYRSSTVYSECAARKKTLIDSLENKLNHGIER